MRVTDVNVVVTAELNEEMARAKKTSDSETLKRQRDLAKERQRKHRAKMTEEELELKRSKDRKRYAKLKSENKIKKVKDMTPREHRRIKKQWRDRKKYQI
ncbi:hypothetical protein J6590_082541 [Homalodisca vitripennis]|nr:hypothetical protein J6590_082541 [Homalodisca vitripennis]